MGLKNLFTRKTKKPDTTKNVVEPKTLARVSSFEEQLEHVFKKFDANGDGKISSFELGSIMGRLGYHSSDEELESMIKKVDANGDGFIGLDEFIEFNTKGVDSLELLESLKEAFLVFDVDRNGLITADELMSVLASLGEEFTIGECRKMIEGFDRDGDGVISFDEFKVMMMNNL